MLSEIKEKNSQLFTNHFNEVFGEKFNVSCDGGFPVVGLEFVSKNPEFKINWRMAIDVVKPDYSLQTFAAKITGEGENQILTPEFATIDKTALEFIVGRTIMLSQNLFPQETTETETAIEESSEDTTS